MPAPAFSINGETTEQLPGCPGVYRFLDDDDQALYIGKSINLRNRVRTHLSNPDKAVRQQRMLASTRRIDVRPTAGEIGALLLENAGIKAELPIYNRRQRAVRRMWSISLHEDNNGFLTPELRAYSLESADILATYGAYANRHQARKALHSLARREALCVRRLGLESGRGACFQHQIGRCMGACCGRETAQSHNQRLLLALSANRLSAWPITEPVLLRETAADSEVQPDQEWHLLHNWTYMGTYTEPPALDKLPAHDSFMFDRDTYHILRRSLRDADIPLLCARSLEAVTWPAVGGRA